jgi:DNA-binding NtrC family response regulator
MDVHTCICIVDDDHDVLTSARLFLKQHFKQIFTSDEPQKLNNLLSKHQPQLLLLDMNFSKGLNDGREGLYWLQHVKEISPQTEVVLMTAYGEIETAVKAIKAGAFDFVLKPWKNEKLLATLENALRFSRQNKKVKQLEETKSVLEEHLFLKEDEFVSRSPAMQKVLDTIKKVAATDAHILLLGENGTGKSVLATAIHKLSERKKNSFITVDLGALNENLFESELFGHRKGAFTDAHDDKPGRFETADNGTIFLDEIGNLSPALQAKMLTVLQNHKVVRLGENNSRDVNVRVISATNMPLYEMVQEGSFRQDLLYRINTVEIEVPALRNRQEDIPLLANRFLQRFLKKYRKATVKISPSGMDKLMEYTWPGNIRELEHTIERAVIMGEGDEIDQFNLQTDNTAQKTPDGFNLEEMEQHLIAKALENYKGNISKAAKQLGLTRAALYRRMEKHGL